MYNIFNIFFSGSEKNTDQTLRAPRGDGKGDPLLMLEEALKKIGNFTNFNDTIEKITVEYYQKQSENFHSNYPTPEDKQKIFNSLVVVMSRHDSSISYITSYFWDNEVYSLLRPSLEIFASNSQGGTIDSLKLDKTIADKALLHHIVVELIKEALQVINSHDCLKKQYCKGFYLEHLRKPDKHYPELQDKKNVIASITTIISENIHKHSSRQNDLKKGGLILQKAHQVIDAFSSDQLASNQASQDVLSKKFSSYCEQRQCFTKVSRYIEDALTKARDSYSAQGSGFSWSYFFLGQADPIKLRFIEDATSILQECRSSTYKDPDYVKIQLKNLLLQSVRVLSHHRLGVRYTNYFRSTRAYAAAEGDLLKAASLLGIDNKKLNIIQVEGKKGCSEQEYFTYKEAKIHYRAEQSDLTTDAGDTTPYAI